MLFRQTPSLELHAYRTKLFVSKKKKKKTDAPLFFPELKLWYIYADII